MSQVRFELAMVEYDLGDKVLTDRKAEFYYRNEPPGVVSISPNYQFFSIFNAPALVWLHGTWHRVEPPAVLFVPPLETYAICGEHGTIASGYCFISLFALQKMDDCLPGQLHFYDSLLSYSMNGDYIFSLTEDQARKMKRDIDEWWPRWSEIRLARDEGYSAWALSRMIWRLTTLLDCWRELPAVGKKPLRIQVVEWIMEHLYQPFTLSEMAKDLYLSPEYIQRKFKKETGFTVMNFVLQLKLSYAAQYLVNYSPREVAEKACFPDFSYFCQIFKKHFGKTPAQFRKYEVELREKPEYKNHK